MYSLDINFLNDRPEYKSDATSKRAKAAPVRSDSKAPYVLGGLAMVLLPAIAGGLWFFLQTQNADLEQKSAALDAQLGQLQDVQKKIATINAETAQIKSETQALASVFNQIKPWSAMMQDLRTRTPPGIQITLVKQLLVGQGVVAAPTPAAPASPGAAASPAAAPPAPTGVIQISGIAKSFNDVNDFMLVLQKSSFVKASETRLLTSELKETPPLQDLNLSDAPQTKIDLKSLPPFPKEVHFQIQTALSDIPASELMRELELKGAAGLVTRIEALKQKGVIQP